MTRFKYADKQDPIRIFVSHDAMEAVFARKLRNLLVERLNARVFMTDDLSAGEGWETKLRNELETADAVAALLSPHSVSSQWVLHEIGAAWAVKKPIIPIVTRRDVLNRLPVSLDPNNVVVFSEADLQVPRKVDQFIEQLDQNLAALQE